MAVMANSSVCSRLAERNQFWMRCFVHVLQKCMKAVFRRCAGNEELEKIAQDLKSVKKIVENAKRCGWNKNLPGGYHLIQDVGNRLGTIYRVTERFI